MSQGLKETFGEYGGKPSVKPGGFPSRDQNDHMSSNLLSNLSSLENQRFWCTKPKWFPRWESRGKPGGVNIGKLERDSWRIWEETWNVALWTEDRKGSSPRPWFLIAKMKKNGGESELFQRNAGLGSLALFDERTESNQNQNKSQSNIKCLGCLLLLSGT